MNILGVSAFYHDSSAALVSNGKVLAAAAEERFTRQKHDSNFPQFAVDFCLREAGLPAQELDHIVFYEEPHTKFTRVLTSALAPFPFSRSAFVRSMKSWIGEKLWTKNDISKRLDVHPRKIEFAQHHLSHAAQAFVGSSFDQAAILTVDAVGEWASTSLFTGSWNGNLNLKRLEVIPYPHSLGLLYSVFTAFIGFRPNDGECSTMALATFGKPIYADQIRKIIRIHQDGTYSLDQSYFNFNQFGAIPYSRKFIKVFGQSRSFKDKLPYDTLVTAGTTPEQANPNHQRYADIASSVQLVLEEALLALLDRLYKLTGMKKLCMAGGVALNCVANSRILRESKFEKIYIPPDPGDGGAALGAAFYSYFSKKSTFGPALSVTPYLGKSYDTVRDAEMLAHVDPDDWIPHRMEGCPQAPGLKLDIKHHQSFEEVVTCAVDDLTKGRVVGWVQGRFENGPRALGNRSLLLDPRNLKAAKRMSAAVKSRAPFRPYAFAVPEEAAGIYLHINETLPSTARWMQMVAEVKEDKVEEVAAAVHIDGTTRPQVCSRAENPRFHKLLSAFGQATGSGGALLNTSFNESGYPIVSSPAEALLVFARTNMDTIIINNLVVRKVEQ